MKCRNYMYLARSVPYCCWTGFIIFVQFIKLHCARVTVRVGARIRIRDRVSIAQLIDL